MNSFESTKVYDLEERTFAFAKRVRFCVRRFPKTVSSVDDIRQVVRSSGSIGANYIEANEALGKKDFWMRVRISRKEAKETIYWLRLLETQASVELQTEVAILITEANEIMRIMASILHRSSSDSV